MKALFLTNEYPPHVYGGAGVHVDYLSRELAKLIEVEVRCFGEQNSPGTNPAVRGFGLDAGGYTCPKALRSVFGAVQRCLLVQPFRRDSRETELRVAARDHGPFSGTVAAVETRTTRRRL
jgi:hypothetical protein